MNPSSGCRPAFQALKETSASSFLDISQFPSDLLVTQDFARTIQARKTSSLVFDSFQRSVRWILTSSQPDAPDGKRVVKDMVIISPFEANSLLPIIKGSNFVALHLYAARQNLSFASLDKLNLYTVPETSEPITIPEALRIQLNLFAGQLYLGSYFEYQCVCDFLGLSSVETSSDLVVAADGFIMGGKEGQISTFHHSPLKFLKVLMSQIRKDSQAIGKTHIGKIVDGVLLTPSDFMDTSREVIDLDTPSP